MFFVFLLIIFLVNLVSGNGFVPYPYEACPSSGQFALDWVSVDPVPAVRHGVLTMNFTGQVNLTLTGGALISTIYFMNLDILDQTLAFEDLIALPVRPGSLSIPYYIFVAGDAPPGTYTAWLHFFDQLMDEILCLYLSFNITHF
jgi:hypothetical protein